LSPTEPLPLIHYILVRLDLPLGVAMSQVAHAAGESFYVLGWRDGTEEAVRVDPSISQTRVVILGVKNEAKLVDALQRLREAHVEVSPIFEPDEPYNGQLMAIGVLPTQDRDRRVAMTLRRYQTVKRLIEAGSQLPDGAGAVE
jgi:hypothetical protein